jgi:hypothetical protein
VADRAARTGGRIRAVFAALSATLLAASAARADNSLNSLEKPDSTQPPPPPGGKNDFNLVPVAGGSTDIGVGGGFFAGLARDQRGYVPYRWNIEAAAFATVGVQNGVVDNPYTDAYVLASVPRFLGAPVLLELRPSFTLERTLNYYGMGNASSATPPPNPAVTSFEYGHLHPTALADIRFKIVDHVAGITGFRYTFTSNQVPDGSKLAYDSRFGSAEVKSLIGPTGPESIAQLVYGVELDTRDNETTPHSGTYDRLGLRLSPGGIDGLPFRYGEATAILRQYVPLGGPRVTLAVRVVGDLLFGNAPLTDLSCAEGVYALGGSNGVRGVPAQRYYGKAKVFGNIETRVKLFNFHAFSKSLSIGAAAFFDAGRVWADVTPQPQLDGSGIGLKYGVGAGLRLMSGTAFVLRGDIAWSPDATPIGGYVAAGEVF